MRDKRPNVQGRVVKSRAGVVGGRAQECCTRGESDSLDVWKWRWYVKRAYGMKGKTLGGRRELGGADEIWMDERQPSSAKVQGGWADFPQSSQVPMRRAKG
ncbi:hypothetical protein E4U40_003796 [Claviceps sp. LM458 group G5]|nr:hypothetical protein E4U40_003796 [Claviceps sp. LM458 group G5]